MLMNVGAQVLMVRYLSKADYGAFAYAMALVTIAQQIVTLGLNRAVTRFLPIYDERRDNGALLGTFVMVISGITFLGVFVLLAVHVTKDNILTSLVDDETTIQILVVLVLLAPVQAFDDVLIGLFAVFSGPRAIFFRRYLVGPALRLAVVALLVTLGGDVVFLAGGWVLAGVVGVVFFFYVLARELGERGVLKRLRAASPRFPVSEVISFTVPLLVADAAYLLITTTDVIILGYFHDSETVAAYRVIQPAANLNLLVTSSFALLFIPAMARLFERGLNEEIDVLYWRTGGWLAVLAFPVFAITFSLAGPLTVLLWGERYASSAAYLSILSVGLYCNGALGFNGLTLMVFGRMRYIVSVNLASIAVNLALNLWLIPLFGAFGAALATTISLLAYNIAKQVGLALGTSVRPFRGTYLPLYTVIALSALTLALVQAAADPPIAVSVVLALVASALVLIAGRTMLDVASSFPELDSIPLVRRILGR